MNIQTSVLLLDMSERCREVLFVDASSDLGGKGAKHPGALEQIAHIVSSRRVTGDSALVPIDAIAANDFNISVDRYVRSDEEQRAFDLLEVAYTVELGAIAELIRPQSLPPATGENAKMFAEVALQDISSHGVISPPRKRVEVDFGAIAKAMRQTLQPGDLLLSVRARIGDVGIVPEFAEENDVAGWLASQAFVIVRVRDTSPISGRSLYRYLSSPFGRRLLNSFALGATVSMVSMNDLKRLRVIVPTAAQARDIERQQDKIQGLRAQIRELEQRIEEYDAAAWPMTELQKQAD